MRASWKSMTCSRPRWTMRLRDWKSLWQYTRGSRSRGHLSLADDVVAVEVIELEQEAVAVERACRGEIVRSERGLPLSVEEDDEVAGLAVEPFGLSGTPPTPPRIEKMLLQGDVPEVLRQHQPKGWVGSEYARNGCSNRRKHPVIAEQGSGRVQGLGMDDQDGGLLPRRNAKKPPGGGVSGDLRHPERGAEGLLEEGQGGRGDQGRSLACRTLHKLIIQQPPSRSILCFFPWYPSARRKILLVRLTPAGTKTPEVTMHSDSRDPSPTRAPSQTRVERREHPLPMVACRPMMTPPRRELSGPMLAPRARKAGGSMATSFGRGTRSR